MRVDFTFSKPKDCQIIVREICNQHINDEQNLTYEEGRRHSEELSELKRGYQNNLLASKNHLAGIRDTVAAGGGDVLSQRMSFKQIQLEEASHQMGVAELELKGASVQLENTKESLARGVDPYSVDQLTESNPQLQQQKNTLDYLESQYESMRDQLGDSHPRVLLAKTGYDRQKKKVDDLDAQTRAKARNGILDSLASNVAAATKTRDELKQKVDELQTDLSDISGNLIQYYSLEQEQKIILDEIHEVDKQLDVLDNTTKQKLEGKISWSQQPEQPSNPSFPKLKFILPIAIALGLIIGVGIAFLREMTDTTVRSDRDVIRVQMQLLGMIGDESQDPQATGARLPLVIFDAPHSMTAEQLRQVRTRLQHAATLDTTRSLLITSPSPGDGKTTIACNLAAGLALNGRRILLVDSNFRRPEIHKVFGLANDQGFSDVLNGAVTFDEVVQETQVPNLAVMTSGPKPINATEMFESQLLIDFIERALEEFDHVIFDSGPLMVVSESQAMASRVDGVVTVVRARGNSRGLLTRMRDSLRALKAEHLGVVLNGVRAQGGGYYGRNIKTFYEYQNT